MGQDTISKYKHLKDKMLMILTYDFESSLPKNADFLANTTLKNLDEFNKADEFDTFIRKHFAAKSKKKKQKEEESKNVQQEEKNNDNDNDEEIKAAEPEKDKIDEDMIKDIKMKELHK